LSSKESCAQLDILIRARYPLIYVVSFEEGRVLGFLREIAGERAKKIYCWSATQGLEPRPAGAAPRLPQETLDYFAALKEEAILVLKDFHYYISDSVITRRLRDLAQALKNSYKNIVILSPVLRLPIELEKDISVVDFGLPDIEDLGELLDNVIESCKGNPQLDLELTPDKREQLLKACQGLTLTEAENVLAKSLVEKRTLDVDSVFTEKEQIVRKSGLLEYYRATEKFADVGGLDVLKDWLNKRTHAFTEKAREFGLPEPRGILILGVQGCGKSLSCKAVASLWRLPLLRLDVGRIFSGIVGSSEENVRRAIRTTESIAPVILWMDELEKGFAGVKSSPFSDAGTTSRVFGTFITWLQEKTAPVFVVATANDISALPPELLRKGRFDEIFFVDLPSEAERREILEIHLRKRKRDPARFDLDLLAKSTAGCSGAEIEQAIIAALYDAFNAGRELRSEDILTAVRASVPLSVTMEEQIDSLRLWASTRARMASSAAASRHETRPQT